MISLDMLPGKILIPPPPYQYCLRVRSVIHGASDTWTYLKCTRLDLSEDRQPIEGPDSDAELRLVCVHPDPSDPESLLTHHAWNLGPDSLTIHQQPQLTLF